MTSSKTGKPRYRMGTGVVCAGKQAHATAMDAIAVARKLMRKDALLGRKNQPPTLPYLCLRCRKFHVGRQFEQKGPAR